MADTKNNYVQPLRVSKGDSFHKVGENEWLVLRPNKGKDGKLPEFLQLDGLGHLVGYVEGEEKYLLTVLDQSKISSGWDGNYAKVIYGSKATGKWVNDEEKIASFLSRFRDNKFLTAIHCNGVTPLELLAEVLFDKKVIYKVDYPVFKTSDFDGWDKDKREKVRTHLSSFIDKMLSEGDVDTNDEDFKQVNAYLFLGTPAMSTNEISARWALPVKGYPKLAGKGEPKWESVEFTLPGKEDEKQYYSGGSKGQSELEKLNERFDFINNNVARFRDTLLQYGVQPTSDNLLSFALSFTGGTPFIINKTGEIPKLQVVKEHQPIEETANGKESEVLTDLSKYYKDDVLREWFNVLLAETTLNSNIKPLEVLENLKYILQSHTFNNEEKNFLNWLKKNFKVISLLDLKAEDVPIVKIACERVEKEVKINPSYSIMLETELTPKF